MKKKITLLIVFLSLLCFKLCFGMDWVRLHEEADKKSLLDALSAIQRNPESKEDLYALGLVYLNLHKDKDAGEVFKELLAIDPDLTEAKWGNAEVLRRQHRLEESEKSLEEIIRYNPRFSPAYISKAYIRYTWGDFNQAVKLAAFVLKEGRHKVDLSNYVRALLLLGGTKGMIAHYGGPLSKVINGTGVLPNLKKAKALQPDSPGVLFGLGSFYLLAPHLAGGDRQLAEEYLQKAINADPFFADPYVRMAQLCKLKGDNNKYQAYLNKALEIDPLNELALDISRGTCRFICVEK
ncbi:MAG: hypothetical protein HY350_02235 [Candidatus Omnitrophica bacterium]|nr:hypothetical protein [Candidatus Omnitrophota bacterium]